MNDDLPVASLLPDNLLPQQLLPHKAPMVLLDEVVAVEDESAHCRVRVGADTVLAPFLDQAGNLPGWFALEIMAQTIGVWSGWHQRQRGDAPPRLGMLLGARAFRCQQPSFRAGSTLDVQMTLLMQDDHFGSFEAVITSEGEVLASARLNTYQPDDNELKQLFQQEDIG